MRISRPGAEEQVRRTRFPTYPSKASIPRSVLEGEFEQAVADFLREQWRKERSNFTADDRAKLQQMRTLMQMLRAGYVQVELTKDFVRFQAKLMASMR
jgi:hypothetical protein